jgi:hypothetical protein
MGSKGAFGYKIGKKLRLMSVNYDADLLWQILVREIYVLIKHYKTIETLREGFVSLKDAKGKPKPHAIEKCKLYTDLKVSSQTIHDWCCLLKYCQHSFINILESGYLLNNGSEDSGLILLLDFNTNSVIFYDKNYKKEITIYEKATIDEIMEFEDMPTKSLIEIVEEMNNKFKIYKEKLEKIRIECEKIELIINKAKELGGENNIIQKAKQLLDDMELEKTKLDMGYRVFYNRIDDLNLIDHTA